jgi:hypothetical protein
MLRIYDLSGQVLVESKPSKVDLKPGPSQAYTFWRSDIANLKPAIYRVDVLLGSKPVWRVFFRVRD